MLRPPTWNHIKLCFFANVFLCNISSGNYFHKHDIYNLIYMIIHVKRQLRQSNVKSVENISRITKQVQKKAPSLVPNQRFQHFKHLLWNLKLKWMAICFSISLTGLYTFLNPWALAKGTKRFRPHSIIKRKFVTLPRGSLSVAPNMKAISVGNFNTTAGT